MYQNDNVSNDNSNDLVTFSDMEGFLHTTIVSPASILEQFSVCITEIHI